MRISSVVAALAVLVTAVAGCQNSEIGCPANPPATDKRDLSARNADAFTNAELLRRGLPLNNPVLRRGTFVSLFHTAAHSNPFLGVAGTPARRTVPSSVPPPVTITHTGIIEVHDASNGNLLGYISKNLVNGGAQLGYDPSIANALLTSFQTDSSGSGNDIDISMAVCLSLFRCRAILNPLGS